MMARRKVGRNVGVAGRGRDGRESGVRSFTKGVESFLHADITRVDMRQSAKFSSRALPLAKKV